MEKEALLRKRKMMMENEFLILLAEKVIGVRSIFSETREMCSDYLTDKTPDFWVSISPEDIDYERKKSDREAIVEGRKPTSYSDGYLETLAVYRKIATELIKYDTLLFHGSVIAVDDVGYMFTAKSGTGKSTHAKLWRERFGNRAVMVNDDKPLLKITEEGVTAYGTPWNGKHRLGANIAVPLKALCILERSEYNSICHIDKNIAFSMLCQQSFRPDTPEAMAITLNLIERLSKMVALYKLECNMDLEASEVAYKGMNS